MRRVLPTFGLIVLTSSLGCELGSAPKGRGWNTAWNAPNSPSASPVLEASPHPSNLEARALTLAAIGCVLAPAVYHPPPRTGQAEPTGSFGPDTPNCVTAAHAVQIRPLRLYRLDAEATFEVRSAISRPQLASPTEPSAAAFRLLFEKTVAAVAEGRRAHAALARLPIALDASAIDNMRAHEMVVALDDFGRTTGGEVGAYARSIALLIATNNFLLIERVPPPSRPFAAEPLFTMLFGSEFLSTGPEEPAASWPEYLGAAARATESSPEAVSLEPAAHASGTAVGGGPMVTDERASSTKIIHAVETELTSLAQQLPVGDLRTYTEETVKFYGSFRIEPAPSHPLEANLPPPPASL